MATEEILRQLLARFDGRGYKAYKQLRDDYDFGDFTLHIDHVQGDPFATPTKIRVRVDRGAAGIPERFNASDVCRLGAADFFARAVRDKIAVLTRGSRGSGRSGVFYIDAGGQEVLQRTAVVINASFIEARLQVGLPASGRTVLGRDCTEMLCEELPAVVRAALFWERTDAQAAHAHVDCVENYVAVRERLRGLGLVAFVAEGAILPRKSGASDLPLDDAEAVPFTACTPYRVSIPVPNPVAGRYGGGRAVEGLGVPAGVTLVVGGGYHGKSTVLRAIERGVYPHVPGDGREYVVTDPSAVKIRAEDGRRVTGVDISPFITNLPRGRSTTEFRSEDASGSTSQAANIVEALELGTTLLLLDEDTSATNFMVRDARMQALVHKDDEPITPFLDRVRELYETLGVSTILVMGGCGDYFDAADQVIAMKSYVPSDVTDAARDVATRFESARAREVAAPLATPRGRVPDPGSIDPSRGRNDVKIDTPAVDEIRFGRDTIDLSGVEQLTDRSQTRAVAHAIVLARRRFMGAGATLAEITDAIDAHFDECGLDDLDPYGDAGRHPGNFARPRRHEIAAAVNRLRTLEIE